MSTPSRSFSGPAEPRSLQSEAFTWLGRTLSVLVGVSMLADGLVQLLLPELLQADMEAIGFPDAQSATLSFITLACVILYAVPKTAIVGTVLLTSFLGGAIAMHFRVGEIGSAPQAISLLIGIMAWAGLYLRDRRIQLLFV